MNKFPAIIFCILCLVLLHTGTTAMAGRQPTTQQWQDLTRDKSFNYANDTEAVVQPKEYKPNALEKGLKAFFNFWGSKTGNAIMWILVGCLVLWLIYRVFFNNDSFLFGKNKKVMNEADSGGDNEEHDLATTNWETLLHHALRDNDLRLAVRYTYMWMLQMLQQHQMIQYRSDKTNYEYYSELKDSGYKQAFKRLSREYEYAWYGRFDISHAMYEGYKASFETMKKQLGA